MFNVDVVVQPGCKHQLDWDLIWASFWIKAVTRIENVEALDWVKFLLASWLCRHEDATIDDFIDVLEEVGPRQTYRHVPQSKLLAKGGVLRLEPHRDSIADAFTRLDSVQDIFAR